MKQQALFEEPRRPLREEHRCHARECGRRVPPEMLMCKQHWFAVPRRIREAVWRSYRDGQCDDKRPSEAWHLAADAAIGYVAIGEGRRFRSEEEIALHRLGYVIRSGVRDGWVVERRKEGT